MIEDFHLIDLISQAGAVRRLLAGKTDSDKLAWLAKHGKLEMLPGEHPDSRQTYKFESVIKQEAVFFLDTGDLVFVGDHSTFTAEDK